MATRLLPAIQQIFSNIGEIGIGFRIKTFATLTTTPLATYSDEALTVPNANPAIGAMFGNQVSDGNGRFGDMWVATLKNYKIVLVDENDVVIDTIDPVDGGSSGSIIAFDPMPEAFWGVSSGSASAYVLDSNVDISTIGYKDTQIFEMQFHIPNIAAPTLAIDGLAALNLKKYNGAGVKVDLEADDVLNQTYCLRNDGVDLIVLNPQKPFFDSRNLTRASETLVGVTRLATLAETQAKVADDIAISPKNFSLSQSQSLLVTQTITSPVTSVDFNTLINSDFQQYQLEIIDLKSVNNGVEVRLQVSINSGITWQSLGTDYSWQFEAIGTIALNADTANSPFIGISQFPAGALGNQPQDSFQSTIVFNTPYNNNLRKMFRFNCTGSINVLVVGSAQYKGSTNPVNGIRILLSSGSISSGIFKLYGFK